MKSKIDKKKNLYGLLPMYYVFLSLLNVAESAPCSSICGNFEQVPEDEALEGILCHAINGLPTTSTTTTTPTPRTTTATTQETMAAQRTLNAEGALPTCNSENQRIVHGYQPKGRGFIVVVAAFSKPVNGTRQPVVNCGGSLLNKKYVLTAAHCVCLNNHTTIPCVYGTNKPNYTVTDVLRVFVGLDPTMEYDKYVTFDEDISKTFRKKISKVKVHPTWIGLNITDGTLDIALILLSRKNYIEFNVKIGPVCLPTIEHMHLLPIHKIFAYSAGWGATQSQYEDDETGSTYYNCFTDNRGPVRHTKCRYPFYLVTDLENECDSECQESFPTSKSKICIQFREANPNFDFGALSFIQIRYRRIENKTVAIGKVNCYNDKNVQAGWCGTCVLGAKEEEEGYCPADMDNNTPDFYDRPEKENTIVTPTTNWGFHSNPNPDSCYPEDPKEPNTLKETMLSILTDKQCKAFTDVLDSNFTIGKELCAGMKFEFPEYKIYDRVFVKEGNGTTNGTKVYKFTLNDTKIDDNGAIREELKELGFYVGFTDTCQGDSGGPLYQFYGGKVYQVGVVSRGSTSNCASLNEPGIYTSLINKETLEWIQNNTRNAGC